VLYGAVLLADPVAHNDRARRFDRRKAVSMTCSNEDRVDIEKRPPEDGRSLLQPNF
jgi:hypothetical protein